jgi:hypothetical protein
MSKPELEVVKEVNKGGRPRHQFTDEQLEQLKRLASIQCTVKEIAFIMGCSTETINRHYADEIETGRAEGKLALRRAQWRNAVEKDNVTMQIWLGKNILKQTDQPIDEDSSKILPWSD